MGHLARWQEASLSVESSRALWKWRVAAALAVLALGSTSRASAQIVGTEPPFASTVEAFANVTGAASAVALGSRATHPLNARIDVALRVFARFETDDGFAFGPRVAVQSLGQQRPALGDRTIVLGTPDWGRLELGYRQGLPDTLTGYAPNSYTFTGVEFGPPTGLNLFPHGGLQTSFLAPAQRDAVGSLSYLGIATAFAADSSFKALYTSPRYAGFQLGLSASPNVDPTPFGADYEQSLQAGIAFEYHFGNNHTLRSGGSYGLGYRRHANENTNAARALHSSNVGVSLGLAETWFVGLSGSYEYAARSLSLEAASPRTGIGGTASINYESGPWAFGGFTQAARAHEGAPTRSRLLALEVGAAYRLDTHLKFYASIYGYDFRDDGAATPRPAGRGAVFLSGVRAQL
ncbi:MAG: porin [Pseudomonadota bacterium]